MKFLTTLALLPNDFLVPLDGDPPIPMPGDQAYTIYHGYKFIGTLAIGVHGGPINRLNYTTVTCDGYTYTAKIFPSMQSDGHYIFIGDEGATEWDADEGMWKAIADSD